MILTDSLPLQSTSDCMHVMISMRYLVLLPGDKWALPLPICASNRMRYNSHRELRMRREGSPPNYGPFHSASVESSSFTIRFGSVNKFHSGKGNIGNGNFRPTYANEQQCISRLFTGWDSIFRSHDLHVWHKVPWVQIRRRCRVFWIYCMFWSYETNLSCTRKTELWQIFVCESCWTNVSEELERSVLLFPYAASILTTEHKYHAWYQ